jgi:2'-5' RNA ligase
MKEPLYFIAIMPPPKIRTEIERFKKEIREKFQVKHALKLPAHITLQIPFRMPPEKEKILFKKLKIFCEAIPPFESSLNGFGKFAKQVIYVNIEDHETHVSLYKDLKKLMLNFMDLKSHEIASKFHPHITIATRDLKRGNFNEVWNEFHDREYHTAFLTEDLHLFKHNGKTWDIIRKFKFEG